jgi:leader peptidase (prepilin peptidase)/N-methyltransferase
VTAFALVMAALVGASIGSFLNVVLYRVPRGESVASPPSRCPSCGTELMWRDNIPIVSWLALRAKCRFCGVRISPRYVLVEVATAVAAVTIVGALLAISG